MLYGILVFGLAIALDTIYYLWIVSIQKKWLHTSAILSALIACVSLASVIVVLQNLYLLVLYVLGSWAGVYVGHYLQDRLFKE